MNNDSNNLNENNTSSNGIEELNPMVNATTSAQPIESVVNNTQVPNLEPVNQTVTEPQPAASEVSIVSAQPVESVVNNTQVSNVEPVNQTVAVPQPVVSTPVQPTNQVVNNAQATINNEPVASVVTPEINNQAQNQTTGVQQSITIGDSKVVPSGDASDGTIKQKSGSSSKLPILLLIIVVLAGVFVWVLKKNKAPTAAPTPAPSPTLAENVNITGHACIMADTISKCTISIGDGENPDQYTLGVQNREVFLALSDYKDYVKVNIYYTQSGQEKNIVDYKIFLKSTNEDISSITTVSELRTKIGLYNEGEYSETLTLLEIGTPGVGANGDETYTYNNYVFKDSNNNTYEMKYNNPPSNLKLVEGNQYTVNFEVLKEETTYNFNIKGIK